MKQRTIVTSSLIASFIFSLLGAYLKIRHFEGANIWLGLGIIATILFIVAAIYEVRSSDRISRTEKNMWTVALICFVNLAGLVYFLVGRKRVSENG